MTKEEIMKDIESLLASKSQETLAQVKALQDEVAKMDSETFTKSLADLQAEVKALKEAPKPEAPKKDEVFSVGAVAAGKILEAVKSNPNGKVEGNFEIMTKANMTVANSYDGSIALTELDTQVDRIARERVYLRNIVNAGSTTARIITFIQQTQASVAAMIAEGSAPDQSEIKYEEANADVKEVSSFIKVSKKMLDDLSFLASEINNDLMLTLNDKLENQLVNGDGTGNNLKGLLEYCQAFDPTGFVNAITLPNLTDVLRVAAAQIAGKHYNPTHIILNPVDAALIQLTKTTTGEYTYPVFLTNPMTGQQVLNDLIVVQTTQIAKGTFIVGDMTKSNWRNRQDITIEFGYENDDFTKGLLTVRAVARAAHYVKNQSAYAFVTGDFDTCKAALID